MTARLRAGLRVRDWRPGRNFGHRRTRMPLFLPGPAPLYSLGTASRIERLRSRYTDAPLRLAGQMTDAWPAATSPRWPS
jgi:hypothetical protein